MTHHFPLVLVKAAEVFLPDGYLGWLQTQFVQLVYLLVELVVLVQRVLGVCLLLEDTQQLNVVGALLFDVAVIVLDHWEVQLIMLRCEAIYCNMT